MENLSMSVSVKMIILYTDDFHYHQFYNKLLDIHLHLHIALRFVWTTPTWRSQRNFSKSFGNVKRPTEVFRAQLRRAYNITWDKLWVFERWFRWFGGGKVELKLQFWSFASLTTVVFVSMSCMCFDSVSNLATRSSCSRLCFSSVFQASWRSVVSVIVIVLRRKSIPSLDGKGLSNETHKASRSLATSKTGTVRDRPTA